MSGDTGIALKPTNKPSWCNPNFAPAYLRRAQMRLIADPEAEVSQDFLKAIELDPNYMEAYLELLHMISAWVIMKRP